MFYANDVCMFIVSVIRKYSSFRVERGGGGRCGQKNLYKEEIVFRTKQYFLV